MHLMQLPVDMDYMQVVTAETRGSRVLVSRSGYTGERGYELLVPRSIAVSLWEQLMEFSAVAPVGLSARDTLRLEMGYPLHGHELGHDLDPVTAGLSWAVDWDGEALGMPALRELKAQGPRRRLRGLLLSGRGVPRRSMKVVRGNIGDDSGRDRPTGRGGSDGVEGGDRGGAEVGVVTSGGFSPTLRQGIALAALDSEVSVGDEVGVQIRSRVVPATVVRPPFVESTPK
jgi:aminomethyltransferase